MSRVITFSRVYPGYHPKAGQPTTNFVEKIHWGITPMIFEKWSCASNMLIDLNKHLPDDLVQDFIDSLDEDTDYSDFIKGHTIRAGHHWKPGDWFSPRVWSGKTRRSKQIIIAPDIQVKRVWNFELHGGKPFFKIIDCPWTTHLEEITDETLEQIAKNDGLLLDDFVSWFHDFSKEMECQIICWDEMINYV